jgi:hypothetical protein
MIFFSIIAPYPFNTIFLKVMFARFPLLSEFLSFQAISVGRRRFGASFQLFFRLMKFMIFVAFVAILVVLVLLLHMTIRDIFLCILAFLPTGWGILLVRLSPACIVPVSSTCSNSMLSPIWLIILLVSYRSFITFRLHKLAGLFFG